MGRRHELAGLHGAELGKGAIRGFIAPDALAWRVHRIAAIAFLVVAVVLVAVDDDLVADLPALDPAPDGPDDAGRVGTGNVVVRLVHVERRDRLAQGGPDAVVVDAGSHHHDQHLVAVQLGRRHHLLVHGIARIAVALAPDGPGIHVFRHIAERRDFTDLIQILGTCWLRAGPGLGGRRCRVH